MNRSEQVRPDAARCGVDTTATASDVFVSVFVDRWRQGEQPDIAAHLPSPDQPHRRQVLLGLIKADLLQRREHDAPPRLEDYLERFPELGSADDLPVDLIAAEFDAHRRVGEIPDLNVYAARFPQQVAALRQRLEADTALEGPAPSWSEALPPGTVVGDFEIIRLLGAGSIARVYLARQRSLDREVALKISRRASDEGRTLARLDHDHIVPVFSEQHVDQRRLLAMRYVPGVTLAQLLERIAKRGAPPRTGRELLELADELVGRPPSSAELAARRELAGRKYVPAVCQIVYQLAQALDHAHRHGVLHCDVKPANVLLAQNGRAMLMDFNVATRVSLPEERSKLGGTVAYMAPEHLAAFAGDAGDTFGAVDARSDVYALGVVLYELLSGTSATARSDSHGSMQAAVRQLLADRLQGPLPLPDGLRVTPSLRSILAKTLAPWPGDRYQSAADLADDLDRYLHNRPLAFADEPRRGERIAKFFRRHPRTSSAVTTTIVILSLLAAGFGISEVRRIERVDRLLAGAERDLDRNESDDAAARLADAQELLVEPQYVLPYVGGARRTEAAQARLDALAGDVAEAEYGRFAELSDRSRARTTAPAGDLASNVLAVYRVLDRADWRRLPAYRALDPQRKAQVDEDITELLLLRALAEKEKAKSGAEAASPSVQARVLDRVPPAHVRRAAVASLRDQIAAPRDSNPVVPAAPRPPGPTEFDDYLHGVVAAKQGDYAQGAEFFRSCLRRREAEGRPPRFWAQFLLAYCLDALGQHQEALANYRVCLLDRPDFAWTHHNLGLVHAKQGQYDDAALHFREAIARDPQLASAFANLGVVEYQQGRHREALQMFDQAIHLGANDAEVYANRAAAKAALGDRPGALDDLHHALEIDPNSQLARQNLERLNEQP